MHEWKCGITYFYKAEEMLHLSLITSMLLVIQVLLANKKLAWNIDSIE